MKWVQVADLIQEAKVVAAADLNSRMQVEERSVKCCVVRWFGIHAVLYEVCKTAFGRTEYRIARHCDSRLSGLYV